MKKVLLTCLMLSVALSCFAVGSGEQTNAVPKNLVVAVPALPDTMEPGDISNQTVAMYRIFMNMYDTLIKFDYKNNTGMQPCLAESWTQVDEKTLDVNLRKGVKFWDGSDFTADDVLATFGPRRALSADSIMGKDKNWPAFQEVQKIDDYKVRFIAKNADPTMAQILSLPSYSIISGKGFNSTDFQEWQYKPLATGPYKIKEFVDNEYLKLEANAEYWGGKPAYDTLTFTVVPEIAARIAGLQAGDFQIICDVSPDLFSTVTTNPNLDIAGGSITTARTIYFNMHKPYQDVYLRKAMSYAIDRDLLVKTLFNGKVEVPNGIQWKSYGDMYISEHPKPKYDPELAKELLKKSAYNGEEIEYRVRKDYYTAELDTAQACIEMWKAIGVNVKIQVCENWGQVNATDENKIRTLGLRNTSHNGLFPDPVSGLWRTYKPSYDATRYFNWNAPDFHEQGKILSSSIDPNTRRAAFKKMLEIWDENPPAILLYNVATFYGVAKNVNWAPYEVYYMDFGPNNVK